MIINGNSSAKRQSMATSSSTPPTTGTSTPPPPTNTTTPAADGSGKKVRKPYTITKSRESWTDEEHDKFLEALHLFDRDWKKIEDFVGSKTVIQIRSHAQKYFLKVQKNGTIAHVPPPRPKRKASHPYPQKASKNVLMPLQASMAYPSSINTLAPGYAPWDDASVLINTATSKIMPSQDEFTLHGTEADLGSKGATRLGNNSVCGLRTLSTTPPSSDIPKHGKQTPVLHVAGLPDFAEVYSFIGSVFDPDTTGHVQKLKEMDPINFETMKNVWSFMAAGSCQLLLLLKVYKNVSRMLPMNIYGSCTSCKSIQVLLLMRNLTVNLSSPDFEPIVGYYSKHVLQSRN